MACSMPGQMHLSDLRGEGAGAAPEWKSKSVGDQARASDAIERAMRSVNELKAKAEHLKSELQKDDFGTRQSGR